MNREILFRGKRTDNGEWLEGYVAYGGGTFIVCGSGLTYGGFEEFEVDPSTVGQYIGLKDKNGTKIFEGDALSFEGRKETFEIWWSEGFCGFVAGRGLRMRPALNPGTTKRCKVVGNVHDNPELLEVEDDDPRDH